MRIGFVRRSPGRDPLLHFADATVPTKAATAETGATPQHARRLHRTPGASIAMFRLNPALLILASTACLAPIARALATQTQAPAATSTDPAFDAAAALKKKAAYAEAAAAFEAYAQAHPNEPRAGEALNEAAVCWFSVGARR
jgi:TolA-binding protein